MENIQIYKGDIAFSQSQDELFLLNNGYMVVENGVVNGVFETLPQNYAHLPVKDHAGKMILPGFVDIHLHAAQFNNVGLGLDEELLPWLKKYTFPEEQKFSDEHYAKTSYSRFLNALVQNGTTSSILFASIYKNSTIDLMEAMEQKGLRGMVGKVNMDRNAPDYYIETTENSLQDTEDFILRTKHLKRIKPIITPRFVPTCSAELMQGLAKLAQKYNLFVQSHLSENTSEIAWVKELHPNIQNYLAVYAHFGLLPKNKTIMAHCVWNDDKDIETLKNLGITIAHCPHSNSNVSSGIAPVSKYLKHGLSVGLGSDISGGHELFMPRVITHAMQLSNLYWRHLNQDDKPLTFKQAYYMATLGGGKLFGNVGALKQGYKADFIVVDDSSLKDPNERSLEERLMRFIAVGSPSQILATFVDGLRINQKENQ